jgi:hypothetical protein
MRAALAIVLATLSFGAWAGGTAFACRYEGLVDEGSGKYLLTLHAIEDPDVRVSFVPNRRLVLHIQHSVRNPLPSGFPPVSAQEFNAAIVRIRADLNTGAVTRFGVMGSALREMKGQTGHYRVYGLRLEDEKDSEKPDAPLVVYAY